MTMRNSKVSFAALLVVAAATLVSVADGHCIWYGQCGTNPNFTEGLFGGKPLNRYDNSLESSILLMLHFSVCMVWILYPNMIST